jgi:hypothetical protein
MFGEEEENREWNLLEDRNDALPIRGVHMNGSFISTYSDRKVMLLGGFNHSVTVKGTFVYNVDSQSFVRGPDIPEPLRDVSACYLEGKNAILCSGGYTTGFDGFAMHYEASDVCFAYLSVYDMFMPMGHLSQPRWGHRAVFLRGDDVFISGGCYQQDKACDSFEVFNTALGKSHAFAVPHDCRRYLHGAAMLHDGRVLLCGGRYDKVGRHSFSSCVTHLYDSRSKNIHQGVTLPHLRDYATATTLTTGDVLLMGHKHAMLYDHRMMQWRDEIETTYRFRHFATRLPDGEVMIGGGDILRRSYSIYDEQTNRFTRSRALPDEMFDYTAACLF